MNDDQEIRQVTMFIFKGSKISLHMIEKAIKLSKEKYKNRSGERSLESFKKNINNYQKIELEDMDKVLFNQISKKYNLIYSVEFDKKENISYVLFNNSVDKINDILKEYNSKLELKNSIKTKKKSKSKTKNRSNKSKETAKEKINELAR